MSGIIEERVKKLKEFRMAGIVFLIVFSVLCLTAGIGLAAAGFTAANSGEENVPVSFRKMIIPILFIAVGILILIMAVNRIRKRKKFKENPYAAVKIYGTAIKAEEICALFNKEYAEGQAVKEIFDKTSNNKVYFTKSFILEEETNSLSIAAVSSIIAVFFHESSLTINGGTAYGFHHDIFTASNGSKKQDYLRVLFQNSRQNSAQLIECFRQYGIPVSNNENLRKLADTDYIAFERECKNL